MKLGFRYNRGVIIGDREKEDSNWGENSLKTRIGREWKKFKAMSRKEKIQYYFSYYFLKTLLLLFAIAAVVALITVIVTKKDPYINGGFLNVNIEEDSFDYLTSGFDDYLKNDKTKSKAFFSGIYTVSFGDDGDYNNKMVFDTLLRGEHFDYIICDEDSLKYLNDEGYQACMSINAALDEKVIKDLQLDSLLYRDELGKAIAIKLDKIELLTKYNANPETCYLVFVPNGAHKEYYGKLVEYLLK